MHHLLQELIKEQLSLASARFISIGGGSINQTFRIESPGATFFCKINSTEKFPGMFKKELNGLLFLQNTNAIKVPNFIWCGERNNVQVLVLEWIQPGVRTNSFWEKFGKALANVHAYSSDGGSPDGDRPTKCGFFEDNYMGALGQLNTWKETWVEFFIECRLQPQLELSITKELVGKREVEKFDKLYKKLPEIFPVEEAVALHGDLWSGNYLCNADGEPVLIDPAVYFGHRGIDLGMTRLFGGFDQIFYDAYHYHFPLPENFEEQADVCNLYPLLIHLNLFGSGYLSSIRSILAQFS